MAKCFKYPIVILVFALVAASIPMQAALSDDVTHGAKNSSFVVANVSTDAADTVRPSPSNATPIKKRPLAQSCIGHGQVCVLNGTPCCGPYQCRGPFPNTSCQ
jgi:hypothetical protein